jgi:hypothetical protein
MSAKETCLRISGDHSFDGRPEGVERKRINISTVLTGQKLGIKEVDDGIWLVSFTHYDLEYFDLEQKTLQPLDNPFGTRLSPIS